MAELDLIRPDLYPKQLAAIFEKKRVSCIEASTKSGKTSGSIIWLLEQAYRGRPGDHFWWCAPVSSQARIAFDRMRRAVEPRDQILVSLSHRSITLRDSGTVIDFKSGDHPDSLYGEDVHACVINEASRFKEDAWHAIRSTLTHTRGRLRIIGNVRGRKNWFYRLARLAERDHPEMAYHKLTAYDAIQANVLAMEEIDSARQTLPEAVFRELYEAVPSDDANCPFSAQAVEACTRDTLRPTRAMTASPPTPSES
jgi:hypothetical protein